MRDDAQVLHELNHPGITYKETCCCGAMFETTTLTVSIREKEIQSFRAAHVGCRNNVATSKNG